MNIITSSQNETYQYATFHRSGRKPKIVRIWHYSRYGIRRGDDWGEYYVTNPDDEDMADGWCAFDGEIGPIVWDLREAR